MNISKITNVEDKNDIIFFSLYTGVFKAVWYGYGEILLSFLDFIKDRVKDFSEEMSKQIDEHSDSLGAKDVHTIRQAPLAAIQFKFSDQKHQTRHSLIMEALHFHMQKCK